MDGQVGFAIEDGALHGTHEGAHLGEIRDWGEAILITRRRHLYESHFQREMSPGQQRCHGCGLGDRQSGPASGDPELSHRRGQRRQRWHRRPRVPDRPV